VRAVEIVVMGLDLVILLLFLELLEELARVLRYDLSAFL